MSVQRALELAKRGRGTTYPNPVVGAVVLRGDQIVGEGWTEPPPGRHAEIVALDAAGRLARGATLFVTMEPCTHHGRTPPCVDRIVEAGIRRVVAASDDPSSEAGGGLDHLRAQGIEVELEDSFEARRLNEAWRTWAAHGRPFVILKAAVTLDGRATIPGSRWVTGELARKRVHELRAAVDAVAVGMGTVRADDPKLTARDVDAVRQPRRLAFGHGTLPPGSELELRRGELVDELRSLGEERVQSLLLEGGPTIARSFLREEFVDKLLVFVAPRIAGQGPVFFQELDREVSLRRLDAEQVGEDVLLTAYIHEP